MAIFTGGASGRDTVYERSAREVGAALAEAGLGVVCGGGRVGLMGHIAEAALRAGGEVIGVIPQVLVDREEAHRGLSRLEVVADMHTRKARFAELSEAFVALPGGMGTLEELFEVWTWQYLNIHSKPVALYNVGGFWEPLLQMIDHQVAEGFIADWRRDALVVADEPADLIAQLRSWRPPNPSGL